MSEKKTNYHYPKYSDIPDIKGDGSENIRYNNPDFPLFCRRNFFPGKIIFTGMTMHWHSDVEFVFIKKGSTFYQLDDCIIKLKEGEGIFVNARQFHVITAGDEDCELDCVIFQPMLLCSSKHIEKSLSIP